MQQHGDEIGAAGLGTMTGLVFHWLSWIPLIPAWLGQVVVTLFVSGAAIVANHFIKRELNRRWPDRARKRGDTDE